MLGMEYHFSHLLTMKKSLLTSRKEEQETLYSGQHGQAQVANTSEHICVCCRAETARSLGFPNCHTQVFDLLELIVVLGHRMQSLYCVNQCLGCLAWLGESGQSQFRS